MRPPAVSVIIPVYNTAPYLRRCLDSVCGQTLRDIEIICVNDGSTDGSPDILREYAARDARVKIIDFPQNSGVSAARNAGLAAARGEYLGFVDSDDYAEPDFLSARYAQARALNADLVGGGILVAGLDGRTTPYAASGLFWAALYKRECIQNAGLIFPDIPIAEDTIFYERARQQAKNIGKCGAARANYVYCHRRGSAAHSFLAGGNTPSYYEDMADAFNKGLGAGLDDMGDLYDFLFFRLFDVALKSACSGCAARPRRPDAAGRLISVYGKCKRKAALDKKLAATYPELRPFFQAGDAANLADDLAAYLAAHASYAKMLARDLRKTITARSGKGGQGATQISARPAFASLRRAGDLP